MIRTVKDDPNQYVKLVRCANRNCRVELKDSERGRCGQCKAIWIATLETIRGQEKYYETGGRKTIYY